MNHAFTAEQYAQKVKDGLSLSLKKNEAAAKVRAALVGQEYAPEAISGAMAAVGFDEAAILAAVEASKTLG